MKQPVWYNFGKHKTNNYYIIIKNKLNLIAKLTNRKKSTLNLFQLLSFSVQDVSFFFFLLCIIMQISACSFFLGHCYIRYYTTLALN